MTLTVGQCSSACARPCSSNRSDRPAGLSREITAAEAQSPGLALTGWTGRFLPQRVQVFGETEVMYPQLRVSPTRRRRVLDHIFAHSIPCAFVTKGQALPDGLVEAAAVPRHVDASQRRSRRRSSTSGSSRRSRRSSHRRPRSTGRSPTSTASALLFVGQSGIGKSECVLDLVERGHRLVADDLVIARRRGHDVLIGRGHELQRHYMEIRGVGLIDVPSIFGIRAVRLQKRIEVVV